jgi:hypothetical protein
MAMTAAGTYAQSQAARKSQQAIRGAREAERIRQRALQDQSNSLFNESLSKQGSDTYEDDAKANVDRRIKAQAKNVAEQAPVAKIESQGEAPSIVTEESAQRVGDASTAATIDARNRAIASGFGDVGIGNALLNLKYGRLQGMIGDAMSGSARTLGVEAEEAQKKGAGLNAWGKALTGAGGMVNMYGAMQPTDKTKIT